MLTTRVSSPSRVASPPAAISPFAFMPRPMLLRDRPAACDSSSQNESLDATARSRSAKTSVPIPIGAAEKRTPTDERHSTRAASARRRSATASGGEHEHQRVARACPERCSDDRRPSRWPRRRYATTSTTLRTAEALLRQRLHRRYPDEHLDEEADQDRVQRSSPAPMRAPCATTPRAPRDRRRCSPSGSSAVSAAPRGPGEGRPTAKDRARTRASQTMPHGAQEEPEDKGQAARAEAAAEDRRRPHLLETSRRRSARANRDAVCEVLRRVDPHAVAGPGGNGDAEEAACGSSSARRR